MMRIPPTSSKIASAVTNTARARGTRVCRSVRTPMQKAMSVAIGMPQPTWPGPAAQRRDGRERRLGRRAQFAHDELALDLHAHDEEEDGHKPVVHRLVQ